MAKLTFTLTVTIVTGSASGAALTCLTPVLGPKTGQIYKIEKLRGDVALLSTKGSFLFDMASKEVVPAGADTGGIRTVKELPGGDAWIGGANGLFRFNAATRQVVAVDGGQIGEVNDILLLDGGDALIGARDGLSRYHAATKKVAAVGGGLSFSVFTVSALPNGDALIFTSERLHRFNATSGQVVAVGGANTGTIRAIRELQGGVALIGRDDGLFRYDPAKRQVVAVEGAKTGRVRNIHEPLGGGVLIGTEKGLYRLNIASGKTTMVGGAQDLHISDIERFVGDDALVSTVQGELYRFNAMSGQVVAVAGLNGRGISEISELSSGVVLIGTSRGLLRFDAKSGQIAAVGGPSTGQVDHVQKLIGGGALIAGWNNVYRFNAALGQVEAVGGTQPGSLRNLVEIEGGALVAANVGLLRFFADQPISADALQPNNPLRLDRPNMSDARTSVALSFRHSCAPVADRMELTLVARHPDRPKQVSPVRLSPGSRPAMGEALIENDLPFQFDRSGEWSLTLQQGETALAKPLHFKVAEPSIVARFAESWEWIAGCFFALYAFIFFALLGATRYSAVAFRLLNDAVWAKWLTWPFFFLRHIPSVQRWVLEPWFQEACRSVRAEVSYLDPPVVVAGHGATAYGSALLSLLRDTPRIWLQGRSGMGKSSVFTAWERSYFSSDGDSSLASVAHRFGFVLVTVPVRHYASLPPPEPNRPESWVIEVVRRRFEMFGLGEVDLALVRSMLQAGHIALAFDGMNEADRDNALAAFALQFPRVRLLVTSQTLQESWQLWQLPTNVAELRRGLLMLWLGPEKGAALDNRIVTDGLGDVIQSGYDLRLIADLAGVDPAHAALPSDRIALYRAMLARASDIAGERMGFEGIKGLAWTMLTERRREITDTDASRLGDRALRALTREGVRIIRQVGKLHEFRHDQMRAFLAALWLIEDFPSIAAMQDVIVKTNATTLPRRDQEEAWRFLAALITNTEDLEAMWSFASERPAESGLLLEAFQEEADRRGITLVRVAKLQKREKPNARAIEARGQSASAKGISR